MLEYALLLHLKKKKKINDRLTTNFSSSYRNCWFPSIKAVFLRDTWVSQAGAPYYDPYPFHPPEMHPVLSRKKLYRLTQGDTDTT